MDRGEDLGRVGHQDLSNRSLQPHEQATDALRNQWQPNPKNRSISVLDIYLPIVRR